MIIVTRQRRISAIFCGCERIMRMLAITELIVIAHLQLFCRTDRPRCPCCLNHSHVHILQCLLFFLAVLSEQIVVHTLAAAAKSCFCFCSIVLCSKVAVQHQVQDWK